MAFVIGPTTFAVLTWACVLLVVAIFAYVLTVTVQEGVAARGDRQPPQGPAQDPQTQNSQRPPGEKP